MECSDIDTSDEREEGEIFDDDLEEISDDSIASTPKSGKLNSPEENLRALSLSSVSDLDVLDCPVHNSDRKVRRHRGSSKRKKFHKHEISSGSSSENEEMVKTKKLLKDALGRNQEDIHNSLRTRLKKMALNTYLPQEHEITSLKNRIDVQNKPAPSETVKLPNDIVNSTNIELVEPVIPSNPSTVADVDNELIQLRLEALKTAVINKFQRKKRKIKLDSSEKSQTLEVNKENSSDNVNTQNSTVVQNQEVLEQDQPIVNNSPQNSTVNSEEEVDEDILRAVLLASMAKKITNKVHPPTVEKSHQPSNKSKISFKKQSKTSFNSNIDLPKIDPIIISINNPDSNSEDEFNDSANTEQVIESNKSERDQLEQRIDDFLKQQRAEVEAKTVTVPKTSVNIKSQDSKKVQINSSYKLLPQNKRLEYVMLIQQLKNAETKPRVKRLSSKTTANNLQKNKSSIKTTENNTLTSKSRLSGSRQKQLRIVQHEINGRLQEKSKYVELSPLLKKMEQVNIEQKKHEQRISHLLKQLNDARLKSSKLDKVFNELMQDFLKKKGKIDSNIKRGLPTKPVVKPIPQIPEKPKLEINLQKVYKKISPIMKISNTHNKSVQCKVILENCPTNIEDPNDIEFKTLAKVETCEVPKYSSPLDYMESKSDKILNPMEILCPFEMDGLCRDKDCVYNHCS